MWDGRVEIVAEGEAAAVDQLVEWARQGPPTARVSHVEVRTGEPTGEFGGFHARF
jgi:acylphosphatase